MTLKDSNRWLFGEHFVKDEPIDPDVVLAWRPTAPHRAMYRKLAAQIRAVCQAKLAEYLHMPTAS